MKHEIRLNLRLKHPELLHYLDEKVSDYNQHHSKKISRNRYVEQILLHHMIEDIKKEEI